MAHTTPGDPLSGKTTKGPVISQRQREKITEYIRHAKESSIRLLAGGDEIPGKGNFVPNATFADVPDDARIIQEEIFGPVAVSTLEGRGLPYLLTLDFSQLRSLIPKPK